MQGSGDAPPPVSVYSCLDVSGSIRGSDHFYPEWVSGDLAKEAGSSTHYLLWGSTAEPRASLQEVQAYLADHTLTLGGTDPQTFIDLLPRSGVIDLYVYTDGEICEGSVSGAREILQTTHADLRVRKVVITYVNKNLDSMNVGLSAIFDGHVLEMHRTRVADGKKVHEFDAAPLEADVTAQQILADHFGLDKTESDMTLGVHYLGQRLANGSDQLRQDIRRMVKEYVDKVNQEHRSKTLSGEEEQRLQRALQDGDWTAARQPFVGHEVPQPVKLVQAYCQKFLNESKRGSLIRISAYAPLLLRGSDKGGEQFDEQEEVLLDNIMYLGLSEEAVIVLPAAPAPDHTTGRKLASPVKCALHSLEAKINFDNVFGLDTLFALRTQQQEAGDIRAGGGNVLEYLGAGGAGAGAGALSSSAYSFGKNPFTRQDMECVFLVAVSSAALPAERLQQLTGWNAHMLSRFVRQGRSVPSVPLALALVLERCFAAWRAEALRPEDAAKAAKLTAVCRRYISSLTTPLTFSVALPVVVHGTFQTAARLACSVLRAALDPTLPVDVLTAFWAFMDAEDAPLVWDALKHYAGLDEDAAFPAAEFETLRALASGCQYRKSGRDPKLRERKGRQYSVRMYTKWLDHLASKGCHPQRLRAEELAVRRDLLGVQPEQPLLCVHGCDPDQCRPLDEQPETLCLETGRPTLLNRDTLDMWYVNQAPGCETRSSDSLYKAMSQLARKRTKGKKPRLEFPPDKEVFLDFVNHRVRAFALEGGVAPNGARLAPRLLPTMPCGRLVRDAELVHRAFTVTQQESRSLLESLLRPRAVCAAGPCCEFIRKAVTRDQLAWINSHATLRQVAGDQDVLSGKVSYRLQQTPSSYSFLLSSCSVL